MGQWFLAVYVFASAHRGDRAESVHVVRRRNSDRVDFVAFRREHFLKVLINRRIRLKSLHFQRAVQIDVAKRDVLDGVMHRHGFGITPAFAVGTDRCELNFRVQVLTPNKGRGGDNRSGDRRFFKNLTSCRHGRNMRQIERQRDPRIARICAITNQQGCFIERALLIRENLLSLERTIHVLERDQRVSSHQNWIVFHPAIGVVIQP